MEGKARFILAALMSAVMVCMVTLLVTCLNLGFRSDFLIEWVKAYLIAWPVAADTAYLIMPTARRLTQQIVAYLDGTNLMLSALALARRIEAGELTPAAVIDLAAEAIAARETGDRRVRRARPRRRTP